MADNNFDLQSFLNDPKVQENKPAAIKFLHDKGIIDNQGKAIEGTFKQGSGQTPGYGGHIADFIGGGKLAQGAGQALANVGGAQKGVMDAQSQAMDIQTNLLKTIKANKAAGKDTTRLEAALKELSSHIQQEGNQATNLGTGGLSNKEVVGSAAQLAANLIPTAKLGKLAGAGAKALGIGEKLAPTIGKAVAGAATGYAYDVANKLQDSKKTVGQAFVPGAGTIIGAILPVGGAVLSKVRAQTPKAAEGIINSLIKPGKAQFAYGKNPGGAVAEAKIVANSMEELGQKITSTKNTIGQQIGTLGRQITQTGKTLNLSDTLKSIDGAMDEAATVNNKSVLQRLQDVKDALTYQLGRGVDESGAPIIKKGQATNLANANYEDALNFKRKIGDMTSYTGNPSDDKAVNKALQSTYSAVKDKMNKLADEVSPEVGAQARKLNEQYGSLTSAEVATRNRLLVEKRQDLVKWGAKFSIGGTVLYGLASGNYKMAAELIAGELAVGVFSTATGKTRLARAIGMLAPKERAGLFESNATIKQVYDMFKGGAKRAAIMGASQITK